MSESNKLVTGTNNRLVYKIPKFDNNGDSMVYYTAYI